MEKGVTGGQCANQTCCHAVVKTPGFGVKVQLGAVSRVMDYWVNKVGV